MSVTPAVALGYQGFGNVGDEAILAGIERLLSGSPIAVRVVIGGDRAPIPAMPTARRVTSRRLLPGPSGLRALRVGRVLLLAGGGLIHDHWPIVTPRYLAWSLAARALGLRIVWCGVGVGPLRGALGRHLAAATVRLASAVTVRDEASREWIHRVAPTRRVSVVPDPAFFLEPPPHEGGDGLALIVRQPVPGHESLAPHLSSVMAALARERLAAGGRVTFLGMERQHDEAYLTAIAADSVVGAGAHGMRPRVEYLPLEPQRALDALARFDEAVSVRLHGLILCALAGTPCVPMTYDAKVTDAAARLGLDDLSIALEALSTEALGTRLIAAGATSRRADVADRLSAIRSEEPRVASLIASAVDG